MVQVQGRSRPTLSLHRTEPPIHASWSPPRQTSRWPGDPQDLKHTDRSINRDTSHSQSMEIVSHKNVQAAAAVKVRTELRSETCGEPVFCPIKIAHCPCEDGNAEYWSGGTAGNAHECSVIVIFSSTAESSSSTVRRNWKLSYPKDHVGLRRV